MNFPKSVLVIKYYVPEKGTPIGITSFEIAKKFFWEEVYELFEIKTNGDLRILKEQGVK